MEEIVGERLRLSNINNRMNEERFADLRACVEKFKEKLSDGTGYIHESVHKDDDTVYSRAWFAWANSLFAYMILDKFS